MMGQRELANKFERGEQHGRASNVHITVHNGGTALVGYGWAVYGYRDEEGKITYFEGWDGYSGSTTSQLTRMGLRDMADEVVNQQPTIGTLGSRGLPSLDEALQQQ